MPSIAILSVSAQVPRTRCCVLLPLHLQRRARWNLSANRHLRRVRHGGQGTLELEIWGSRAGSRQFRLSREVSRACLGDHNSILFARLKKLGQDLLTAYHQPPHEVSPNCTERCLEAGFRRWAHESADDAYPPDRAPEQQRVGLWTCRAETGRGGHASVS